MRLLVADDEAAVREALALVLDLNGFEVTTAVDGREALRALSAFAARAPAPTRSAPAADGPAPSTMSPGLLGAFTT